MEPKNHEVIQIDDITWSIENIFVRFFLLKGKEKALMIDTGLDVPNVKDLAREILGLSADDDYPIELLNTHADGDHCHGNQEFDWFYMHEADVGLYRAQFGEKGDAVSVSDGQIIDLGDRPLEIITIPGHTHGSIAILDINNRVLYPGDSVQDGDIFMFGGHRNLDDYPASLIKLQDMDERFDVLHPSHGTLSLDPDYIGKCFDACESMMHGEVEPGEREAFDGKRVSAYDCGDCTFLIDPARTFEPAED